MEAHVPWSWVESLGGVRPDPASTLRVTRILFGLVRDRCSQVGVREGQTLRCRSRNHDHVTVELRDGELHDLELSYAWFVQVEPIERSPDASV